MSKRCGYFSECPFPPEQTDGGCPDAERCRYYTAVPTSHSEAAILRGCISLMQELMGRFEDYLDWIGYEPPSDEERFSTRFPMTEIAERLFLWETRHSGGTSQMLKLKELGVTDEYELFSDTRGMDDAGA